jgi:endoglucanase
MGQYWGVNLSGGEGSAGGDIRAGSVESYIQNWDYVYPTAQEIDYYAYRGQTVLRLPFLARRLLGPEGADDIAILRDLIDYAASRYMVVVLDSHGAGPNDMSGLTGSGLVVGSSDEANREFAGEWSAIAEAFKDKENVIFGLMNEPRVVSASQFLVAANMAIDAIRDTGAVQTINVPGAYGSSGSLWTSTDNAAVMLGVVDPLQNFNYEIHQYIDFNKNGVLQPGIGAQALVDVTNWARANNASLFLGEYAFAADPGSLHEGADLQNFLLHNADIWSGATYWGGGSIFGADYSYVVEPAGLPGWWEYNKPFNPETIVDRPQMSLLAWASYAARTNNDFGW